MDSQRLNFNKCSDRDFAAFIDNIKSDPSYIFRAHNPADESVAQDRYTFTKNGNRVSVVYETKAKTLIITAPADVIEAVAKLVVLPAEPPRLRQDKQLIVSAEKSEPKQPDNGRKVQTTDEDKKRNEQAKPEKNVQKGENGRKVQTTNEDKKRSEQPKQPEKNVQKGENGRKVQTTNEDKKRSEQPKQPEKNAQKGDNGRKVQTTDEDKKRNEQPKTEQKRRDKNQSKQNQRKTDNEGRTGDFTVKKVTVDRVNELVKKIKANKNMRCKTASGDGFKTYTVTSGAAKATIRYVGGGLQLSGAPGALYSELQLMMSQLGDYKTAIKTHIKLTGEEKRAGEVERQLKKKLPAAFEFLSEQAKIDLAIGILDINNPAVVLSDYSTLLIPCFRGLERFIFDLQHAQGIVVKMIGQAYEKEDGNYVLKSGYRRKIPSVIYAEVMAALYTEYFKQRNFYAHSDGGYDNMSRIITDKQQVQAIFAHILEVINYNGKKLKEIGFSTK